MVIYMYVCMCTDSHKVRGQSSVAIPFVQPHIGSHVESPHAA